MSVKWITLSDDNSTKTTLDAIAKVYYQILFCSSGRSSLSQLARGDKLSEKRK